MTIEEDKLKDFVQSQEGAEDDLEITAKSNKNIATSQIGPPIIGAPKENMPWHKKPEQISLGNQLGWSGVTIADLPTMGYFYPEGTEIAIRSATTAEIRHWSTLNEEDLSSLDDMLNYILERCCTIKLVNNSASSWRDIKEVDRFYLLLAIRERTFVGGENALQVKISETKKIDVVKDMIDYISFDDRLMKYYDTDKRCISLKFITGKILDIHMPSVGVTNWLKTYITRKSRAQESFDQDFINFAPFIIPSWRGLNDASYEKFVYDSTNWSNAEISMLTEVRQIFADTINPVIRYTDEQGGERTVPLNFQGGIKSIFLISNPFSHLA